jgi:hypothetical protein
LGKGSRQKKRARRGLPAAPWLWERLELEFAGELQYTRVIGTGDIRGTSGTRISCTKAVPQGMVEGVERLKAKLEPRRLTLCQGK